MNSKRIFLVHFTAIVTVLHVGYGADVYEGRHVSFNEDYDAEEVEWINKPEWAIPVIWGSK